MATTFRSYNGCEVSYAVVREACVGTPYTMSLVGDDASVVAYCVNQGIDSHLEACSVPARGDKYTVSNGRLHCVVSPESMPVLLRRLCEVQDAADLDDATCHAGELAESILLSIGIDGYGEYVGLAALGLE